MSALPAGTAEAALARLYPEPSPYLEDPVGWVDAKLGEFLWSTQREIAMSVVANRYTGVQSCHDSGKSFIASRLACWWLDVHAPGEAFVVSSAPTQTQVEAILWREIGKAHRKGDLDGRITYGMVPQWKLGQEIVGYGRKPQDLSNREEAMAAFQGIHARYVLIILDEAGGIPKWLFDAADALATNEHARVLAIGNPDDPHSHFVSQVMKPGSDWSRITIDGYETPNFTGEEVPDDLRQLLLSQLWVDERKQRWGESSPLFTSKVRGRAPDISDNTVFSPALLKAAQERELPRKRRGQLGCDIARMGEDRTELYANRGGVIRHVHSAGKQDTMATTGMIARVLREKGAELLAAHIDAVGVGAGVYDRLRELKFPVFEFNAGWKARDTERFVDRRAEVFWTLREQMQDGEVDLPPDGDDDELISQLGSLRFFLDSRGRIRIESKEEMRKRGLPSPDRADAASMATIAPRAAAVVSKPKARPDKSTQIMKEEW
jgi:hypothetical protein